MKKFLVFAFMDYYPYGGWNDFRDSFVTLDEAITYVKTVVAKNEDFTNFQIVDIENKKTKQWGRIDDGVVEIIEHNI